MALAAFENPRALYSSRMPILGNDVLQSWMERVRKLGVQSLWLTSGRATEAVTSSELAEFARQGIERLLVIKLKSYAEMDLADLLRFHCESRNPVTEAHDAARSTGSFACWIVSRCVPAEQKARIFRLFDRELRKLPINLADMPSAFCQRRERQELVGDGTDRGLRHAPVGDPDSRAGVDRGRRETRGLPYGSSVQPISERAPMSAPAQPSVRLRRWSAIAWWIAEPRWSDPQFCPVPTWRRACSFGNGLVDGGYLEHLGWGNRRRSSSRRVWEAGFSGVNRGESLSAGQDDAFREAKTASRGTLLRMLRTWLRLSRGATVASGTAVKAVTAGRSGVDHPAISLRRRILRAAGHCGKTCSALCAFPGLR